ncbi:hypothetical protein [Methylibium petroleiphilum]|uniref:hypothetical protein n=1 Tax=Methylibium petroleiphilum TaxID=105560 RepID=UPI003D270E9F
MSPADPASDDSVQLPDWALKALSAVATQAVQHPPMETLRNGPAWQLLLDAAVVATFLPKDLAPEAAPSGLRSNAEETVLGYSETAITPDGTRWELRRDARSEVLRLALSSGELSQVLTRTTGRFGDGVSKALRETLSGASPLQSEATDLARLEALRVAASVLSGIESIRPLMPLPTLDRLIRKRRLVEQFERICGKDYQTEIVGRTAELEVLRAYVGVIGSETILGNVSRAYGHARRTVTGRKPLAIWGTGGVGKTTLLSRFMLEHIDAAERSYPFAYLDFDRPSISPRDHYGLFAELCLQVSAQFEELDASLRELREEALEEQPDSPTSDFDARLEGLVGKFRARVDEFLDGQESFFEWSRPVLIVLDTFEVVQYDTNQVKHLERFLQIFIKSKWPRLRLVVAGRKRIDRLVSTVEPYELQGIDISGASHLLLRLSERASKPISADAAHDLAELLAIKRTMLSEPRVHPLRVRMIADIFRSKKKQSGEAIAKALIDELRGDLKRTGSAARSLVDGILIRRIIDHVTDERVQALADPGLVVRRITPEVIQRVMARGTPPPGSKTQADSVNFESWEMTSAEAHSIFEAFSKEVTLVERDGKALRHRQDVRSEMLPLIKARSPNRFKLLHKLAFDHFAEQAQQGDEASAAEAVYHGLWSGRDLVELDGIWTTGGVSLARIDPEEFNPDSLPVLFLKARNREGMTAEEVSRLPASVASAWASQFGEQFLLSDEPAEAFEVIRAATGPMLEGARSAPALLGVAARLLYRAGAWQDCQYLTERSIEDTRESRGKAQRSARASLTRLAIHLAAKSGIPPADTEEVDESFALLDPIARVEVASNLILGQTRSSSRQRRLELNDMLDHALADVPRRRWAASRRVLRLAILASETPTPDLVATWVDLTDQLPRVRDSGLRRDKFLKSVLTDVLGTRRFESADEINLLWQERKRELSKLLKDNIDFAARVRYLMVFDHYDWNVVLANALSRALTASPKGMISYLRSREFLPSRFSTKGADIVQAAGSQGRFLDLAEALVSAPTQAPYTAFPDARPSPKDEYSYPQSISALAQALLRWHEDLLSRAGRKM